MGDLDGHRYAPEIFDPASDTGSEHSDLQQHEHEFGMSGVIHVDDDDSASSQNPHSTLIRSVHDLDLLIPLFDLTLDEDSAQGWAVARSSRFDSHVSPPLERPPQV